MISIEALTMEFSARPILNNITFLINRKDRIALIGKNGAGKTTLLRLIAGELQPTDGHISRDKELTIGYLPQHMIHAEGTTVREEVDKVRDPSDPKSVGQMEKTLMGLGFERTTSGSDAAAQYNEPLKSTYNNVETCPENLILWFHHLSWDYTMKNGNSLWDELCLTFQSGIDEAKSYISTWNSVKQFVDNKRFTDVAQRLERQTKDAIWWRDATIQYFQQFSGKKLPAKCQPFQHTLKELEDFKMGITNCENPKIENLPEYKIEN